MSSGHMETAGIALEAAKLASAEAAQEPSEPSAGDAASLLANMPASLAIGQAWLAHLRGDADGTAAFASQARSELADGDKMLNVFCQLELAPADWLAAGSTTPSAASLPPSRGCGRPVSAASR